MSALQQPSMLQPNQSQIEMDDENSGFRYIQKLVYRIKQDQIQKRQQLAEQKEAQQAQSTICFNKEQSHFFNTVTRENFF